MRALWDYPVLPYQAQVPWPCVLRSGHQDWVTSVDLVETWLVNSIGPRYSLWTWNMWHLGMGDLCGVSFLKDRDRLIFLLRFG